MVCFVLGILSVPVWAFSGFINLHPLGWFMSLPSRSSGVFQYQSLLCVLASLGKRFGLIPSQPLDPSGSPFHHIHSFGLHRVSGSASLFSSPPKSPKSLAVFCHSHRKHCCRVRPGYDSLSHTRGKHLS